MSCLRTAIGCLTILPFGPRGDIRDADLGGSLLWFPLVGLLISAGLIGVNVLSSLVFPPLVVAACVLLSWVVITGALHLDGLGDLADGIYGGHTREERLRIMKDPHVGAMAVVSITLLLILKFALLSSIPSTAMNRTLLVTPCIGRYAMVLLGSTLPYARIEAGTAAPFVKYGTKQAWFGATFIALLASGLVFGWRGLGLFGIATLGSLTMRAVFHRALGGITGDALGAAGEVTEALMMFVVVLIWG